MNNSFANLQKNDLPVENSLFDELFVSIWPKATVHNGTPPAKVVSLSQFLTSLQEEGEELSQEILTIYGNQGKSDTFKKWRAAHTPIFVPGEYQHRGTLIDPSPVVIGDMDSIPADQINALLGRLVSIPYILAAFPSVTRTGIRFIAWVEHYHPQQHEEFYSAVTADVSLRLDIPLKTTGGGEGPHIDDVTTKALHQVWFFSHVPKELIHVNAQPVPFRMQAESQTSTVLPPAPITPSKTTGGGKQYKAGPITHSGGQSHNHHIKGKQYKVEHTTSDQVLNLVEQIEARRLDLTPGKTGAWFEIGLALFDGFGDHEGLELFHRVSRFYPGYTQEETEKFWRDDVKKKANGSVHIGKFFTICKEAGINVDHASIAAGKRADNRVHKPAPAAKPMQRKEEEVVEEQQDPFDLLPAPDKELNVKINRDKSYYEWEQFANRSKKLVTERISNFIIRPIYHLYNSKNSKRLWELRNMKGKKTQIVIPVEALSNPNKFSQLVENQGNFVTQWTAKQFSQLKEYLFEIEKKAQEITVLGFQSDTKYWAWANGILANGEFHPVDEAGIVEVAGKYYYIPAYSSINIDSSDHQEERKFVYRKGEYSFSKWAKLFADVYGDKAKIGILFLLSSLFRDVIFKQLGFFPMLFLFGMKGSGKSAFRTSLKSLFGNYTEADALSLEGVSTPKAYQRKLAQTRNSIEIFEEYDNNIDEKLLSMLKSANDAMGYHRANNTNDNSTNSTEVNSTPLVGGEKMPTQKSALFSRFVMVTFQNTTYSIDEKQRFAELKGLQGKGGGGIIAEIIGHREMIENQYAAKFQEVFAHLSKDVKLSELMERTLKNMAAWLASYKVLEGHLDFPFTYEEIYRIFREITLDQHDKMTNSDQVSQFWQVFDYLVARAEISRSAYLTEVANDRLFIRLSEIYPKYVEHAKRQGINFLDRQTLESYLMTHHSYKRPQEGRKDIPKTFPSAIDNIPGKKCRCLPFQLSALNLENI